jgi:hypothetical protein
MILVPGLALLVQVATAACVCPRPNPTLDDLMAGRPDLAIVAGRVASVLSPTKGEPTVTRFTVQDVIRGEVPPVVEMRGITFQDDPCGVDFRVGEVRTIALDKRPDGSWFTTDCLVARP